MAKKTKTYRGQRNYKKSLHNGCGCFYCTGNSKQDLQFKKQSIIDKEINEFLKYKSKNIMKELEPVLAQIECQGDLEKSKWYEVVYFADGEWHSYAGSKTFSDGEKVVNWKYCRDCL